MHAAPRRPTARRPGPSREGARRTVLAAAFALTCALALAWSPSAALAQGDAGDPVATATGWPDFGEVVWADRSASLLATGVTSVAVSPTESETVYAGGRGFVARSTDGGQTWQPVLLLVGASLATLEEESPEEAIILQVDPDELDQFDDAEALDQFNEMRDAMLEELESLYGEELAETLIADVEDDLRQEAFAELIDEATLNAAEQDYQARYQALVSAGFPASDAAQLAQDPLTVYRLVIPVEAPNAIYAATGLGLFRSTDGGTKWQRLALGIGTDSRGVLDVAVDRGGATLLAATAGGVIVSDDAGRTWSSTLGVLGSAPAREVVRAGAPGAEGRFYGAGVDGFARSDDGGLTWTSLNPLDFDASDIRRIVAVGGSGTLVAATRRGIYRSDDAGRSWQDIGRGLPSLDLFDVRLLLPDSANGLIVLGERRAYVSIDGGSSWRTLASGLVGQTVTSVTVGGTADQLWVGTDTGVSRALLGKEFALQAETVRQVQEIWSREPTPAQLIWATLTYNQLADIPADAWHDRLIGSKFAPRVQVELFWFAEVVDLEQADREAPLPTLQPDSFVLVNQEKRAYRNTEFEWEVWALWDLGALIYDAGEHAIESAELQLTRERRRLVNKVVRLVVARRAMQLRMASEGTSDLGARLDGALQLEESAALLDALTGGFFSASMASQAR